jgi:hypothetical protein
MGSQKAIDKVYHFDSLFPFERPSAEKVVQQ